MHFSFGEAWGEGTLHLEGSWTEAHFLGASVGHSSFSNCGVK